MTAPLRMKPKEVRGDAQVGLGTADPSDLVKVVPGLIHAKSSWNSPVYTLRLESKREAN
jgi:hypothetical protein